MLPEYSTAAAILAKAELKLEGDNKSDETLESRYRRWLKFVSEDAG